MENFDYLIIGGGMTGDAAVSGIREIDQKGSVGLISMEKDEPYIRPALSKGLWKKLPLEKIWLHTREKGAQLSLGKTVTRLDVDKKEATLEDGQIFHYSKLLLATGAVPRRFPFGEQEIIYYRTMEDFRKVQAMVQAKKEFIVIGSGFIGSEIAAALAMNGINVELLDTLTGIGWNIFPPHMVKYLNQYFRERGVTIHTLTMVSGLNLNNGRFNISTKDGQNYSADVVLAGIGVLPEISLAKRAGIATENGILVDENLQTNIQNVFAAGDVASFSSSALGKRIRVEHADNAREMGRQAGRNMTGVNEKYDYLPMFYSDLFDLGYEAVGSLDSRMDIFEDWQDKYKKGVLYYLEAGRVRGVLLWNVWEKLDSARELIRSKSIWNNVDLHNRIK